MLSLDLVEFEEKNATIIAVNIHLLRYQPTYNVTIVRWQRVVNDKVASFGNVEDILLKKGAPFSLAHEIHFRSSLIYSLMLDQLSLFGSFIIISGGKSRKLMLDNCGPNAINSLSPTCTRLHKRYQKRRETPAKSSYFCLWHNYPRGDIYSGHYRTGQLSDWLATYHDDVNNRVK